MKVYVENHGCTCNQGLGNRLKESLLEAGLSLARSPGDADAVVLNTCTVKGRTERRMLRRILELKESHGGRRVIVVGCMPTVQRELIESVSPHSPALGTYEYGQVPAALGAGPATGARGGRILHRPGIGIVPISTGCLGECTYCIVRLIKGTLRSHRRDWILEEVRSFRLCGAHEIWLTSQDLASYGAERGRASLPELLGAILSEAGDMRVRLGMMNPDSLKAVMPGILEILEDERIYRFLHIPVQSGSDRVLESMKRRYTAGDWARILDELRGAFPRLAISTDVIVGYPVETPSDFDETLDLVRSTRPDALNISRFEPRPGTKASLLRQLPGREVKRRSRIMTRVAEEVSLGRNREWIGWKGDAVVSEEAPKGGFVLRNGFYKPVIAGGPLEIGSKVGVTVKDAHPHCLIGEVEVES